MSNPTSPNSLVPFNLAHASADVSNYVDPNRMNGLPSLSLSVENYVDAQHQQRLRNAQGENASGNGILPGHYAWVPTGPSNPFTNSPGLFRSWPAAIMPPLNGAVPTAAANADWTRFLCDQLRWQHLQQMRGPSTVPMTPRNGVHRDYLSVLLTQRLANAAAANAPPKATETIARSSTSVTPVTAPVRAANSTAPTSATRDATTTLVCAPVRLALLSDAAKLSPLQVLLRHQIEAFAATDTHVSTHTRGRTKTVRVGQVGLRCRHCAHVPLVSHAKGSTYFPTTVQGFYQASQNMASIHLQNGACPAMPDALKEQLAALVATKGAISGVGRQYWTHGARQLGLVDTDQGVYFATSVPRDACVIESDAYRSSMRASTARSTAPKRANKTDDPTLGLKRLKK